MFVRQLIRKEVIRLKLQKQLKALNWGTPVVIKKGGDVLFEGNAKEAVRSVNLVDVMDDSLKDVKLVKEDEPKLELVLINKS